MMLQKRWGLIGMWMILTSLNAYATPDTTETLSKGNTKLTLYRESYQVEKIAINGASRVAIKDYKAKHVSAFQPAINANLIDPNLRLLESAIDESYHFGIGHGISDKLSVWLDVPYKKRQIEFTQDYVDAFKAGDAAAGNDEIPGISDEDVVIPPKVAKGEGIGDMTISLRYRLFENLSILAGYSGGFLKTGNNSTEVKKSDNIEELPTGSDRDTTSLKLIYDWKASKWYKLTIIGAYDHFTSRRERYLFSNTEIKDADEYEVALFNTFSFGKTVDLIIGINHEWSGEDEEKMDDGQWAPVRSSNLSSSIGTLAINYHAYQGLDIWAIYEYTIWNKPALGAYEFPGRLHTDNIVKFGVSLVL